MNHDNDKKKKKSVVHDYQKASIHIYKIITINFRFSLYLVTILRLSVNNAYRIVSWDYLYYITTLITIINNSFFFHLIINLLLFTQKIVI